MILMRVAVMINGIDTVPLGRDAVEKATFECVVDFRLKKKSGWKKV